MVVAADVVHKTKRLVLKHRRARDASGERLAEYNYARAAMDIVSRGKVGGRE